ncbi:MAG: hypothetical protein J4A00_10440 [Gammaproteobacteria bacterium]|nr:hypothetical protein [Gammaproteobacteria bacterium]
MKLVQRFNVDRLPKRIQNHLPVTVNVYVPGQGVIKPGVITSHRFVKLFTDRLPQRLPGVWVLVDEYKALPNLSVKLGQSIICFIKGVTTQTPLLFIRDECQFTCGRKNPGVEFAPEALRSGTLRELGWDQRITPMTANVIKNPENPIFTVDNQKGCLDKHLKPLQKIISWVRRFIDPPDTYPGLLKQFSFPLKISLGNNRLNRNRVCP